MTTNTQRAAAENPYKSPPAAGSIRPPGEDGPRPLIERIGIHPPLVWGYMGLLLFMIGDGVEAGYLSKYLVDRGIASEQHVALIFTIYGVTVAIASWLSGALSDLWGPRQVMATGLAIWTVFEVGFLLLGVGPGNWPVEYVRFAPSGDRSLTDDGMTANPWPSSDWVAFISERGFVPTLALFAVFVILFFTALRRWGDLLNPEAVLAQCVLAGTVVATMVVSAFDVVLVLAAPAFLVWSILGATSGIRRGAREVSMSPAWLGVAAAALVFATLVAAARSVTETIAMTAVGRGGVTAGWVTGATWDPGNYRINLRVAELYSRRGRCSAARSYAHQAVSLFPHSPEAKRVARNCE